VKNALYEGTVIHSRRNQIDRDFTHQLFMPLMRIDAEGQLPTLWPLWSGRRRALMWFRRADYLGNPEVALDACVRSVVATELGDSPNGPIYLLAHQRTFGWCFNPIAIFYCYESDGGSLHSIVADVTNTPWGESTTYVIDARHGLDEIPVQSKKLHVSPFLPMDLEYVFHASQPDEHCRFSVTVRREGQTVFRAAFSLYRREVSRRNVMKALVRHPWHPQKVSFLIYFHALVLWIKRVRFVPHPRKVSAQ
jgi:DUF1365 family protein